MGAWSGCVTAGPALPVLNAMDDPEHRELLEEMIGRMRGALAPMLNAAMKDGERFLLLQGMMISALAVAADAGRDLSLEAEPASCAASGGPTSSSARTGTSPSQRDRAERPRRAMARRQRGRRRARKAAPKILRWRDLVAAYKASDAWDRLKPKSQREYESQLRILDHWALDGDLRLCDLDRPMIIELRDTLVRDPRKHRTAAMLRVLRVLCNFGSTRAGCRSASPSSINIPEPPKRRHRLIIGHCRGCSTPPTRSAAAYPPRLRARLLHHAARGRPARDHRVPLPRDRRRRHFGRGAARARRRRRRCSACSSSRRKPRAGRHPVAAARPRRGRGGDRREPRRGQHPDPPDRQVGPPCHEKTFQRDFARVRVKAASLAQMALEATGARVSASNDRDAWASARRRSKRWCGAGGLPVPRSAALGHVLAARAGRSGGDDRQHFRPLDRGDAEDPRHLHAARHAQRRRRHGDRAHPPGRARRSPIARATRNGVARFR
jgi:hypothetical protein